MKQKYYRAYIQARRQHAKNTLDNSTSDEKAREKAKIRMSLARRLFFRRYGYSLYDDIMTPRGIVFPR